MFARKLCFVAAVALALGACSGESQAPEETTGSFVAGARGDGTRWNARGPVIQCADISTSQLPPVEAIIDLVRCEREEINYSDELWLLENVSVRVGKGRANAGRGEFMTMPDADTSKQVYDLQGSWTSFVCRLPEAVAYTGGDAAKNCSKSEVAQAKGACWMTTFGVWRCNMSGPGAGLEAGYAPPQ